MLVILQVEVEVEEAELIKMEFCKQNNPGRFHQQLVM
jgi:hypothetical protein